MKALLFLLALASGCADPGHDADRDGAAGAPRPKTSARRVAPPSEPSRARDGRAPRPTPRAEGRDGLALVPEFPRASRAPYAFTDQDLEPWTRAVPEIREVEVVSSLDGSRQRALFYDPGGAGPRPLLVALHSWSAGYLQNIDIPFGVFARRNGWVFVHPDHRGRNDGPEATNSERALEDVIDAVAFARAHADVDASRIYLVGYSGGAMAALVLAARRPDLWAGVVAWGPIYDLADWYERSIGRHWQYVHEIAASCGGAPDASRVAAAECRRRSPSAHLEAPLDGVGVYIAAGLHDPIVPTEHAVRAFNRLARRADRIDEAALEALRRDGALPPALVAFDGGEGIASRLLYAEAGAAVLMERTSGGTTLVVFDGAHDMVYNPGLLWLGHRRRP